MGPRVFRAYQRLCQILFNIITDWVQIWIASSTLCIFLCHLNKMIINVVFFRLKSGWRCLSWASSAGPGQGSAFIKHTDVLTWRNTSTLTAPDKQLSLVSYFIIKWISSPWVAWTQGLLQPPAATGGSDKCSPAFCRHAATLRHAATSRHNV